MTSTDALLVVLRWAHATAVIVWVGSVAFDYLALQRDASWLTRSSQLDRLRRDIAVAATGTLVLTGGVLTFERLSSPAATMTYVVMLGVKLLLATAMFFAALRSRRADDRSMTTVISMGLGITLLAVALRATFERNLAP
jgi:hypothetical protein